MTNRVSVHASPQHASGGHAIVRLKDPLGVSPCTKISVFDLFRERYLGPTDWQPDPHEFGPYETKPGPDGTLEFCVGPEIVNQISEFTSVRIDVGGHEATLSWPDSILQDPAAEPYGTIYKPAEDDVNSRGKLTVEADVGRSEDPDLGEDLKMVKHKEKPVDSPPPPPTTPPDSASRKAWWLLLALLSLVAAGVGFWWLTQQDKPVIIAKEDEDRTEYPVPEQETLPLQVPCTIENALNSDEPLLDMLLQFADRSDENTCDPPIDKNFARRVMEQAIISGDGSAMVANGDIYNPYFTEPLLQDRLGVSLSDDANIAFDFYRRAIEAGQRPSDAALQALCDGTADTVNMFIRDNREDLCQ